MAIEPKPDASLTTIFVRADASHLPWKSANCVKKKALMRMFSMGCICLLLTVYKRYRQRAWTVLRFHGADLP